MALISSEDSLEQILNIFTRLETIIVELTESKKENNETKEIKADENILTLLTGFVEKAKDEAASTAGKQLEELAKGLKALQEVDAGTLDTVTASISRINDLFEKIYIPDNILLNIEQFVKALDLLGQINEETAQKLTNFIKKLHLENIENDVKNTETIIGIIQALTFLSNTDLKKLSNNIDSLKDSTAEKLSKFITKLITSLQKSLNGLNAEEIKNLLLPIANLFYGLQAIVNTNIFKMKISLNPLKAWLLGRQIGNFIKHIAKSADGAHIDESIKHLGDILSPLTKFADEKDGKSPMYAIKKALSKRNAKKIANFFNILLKDLPKDKEVAESLGIMSNSLITLTKVGIWGSIKFIIFTSTFTEKRAKKIHNFFETLTKGKWDAKKLATLSLYMKDFNSLLKTMSIILVALVVLVTFAPIESIIAGFLLMKMTVNLAKNTIKELVSSLDKKQVKSANEVIKSFTKLIITIVATIAIIAILTAVIGPEPVIIGFAIIGLLLLGATFMIKSLTSKSMKKGLKDAGSALRGIAWLILSASISIGILALIMENTKVSNVLLSLAIIGVVMLGATLMIKQLGKIKSKNLEQAGKAMIAISLSFAIIAITALLFRKIGKPKNFVGSLLGALIVTLVVEAGVLMVKQLSKIKPKNLEEATKALLIITGVFAAVSLITRYILMPIGEEMGSAFKGALIVVGILALLIGGIYLLSNIKPKKLEDNLKSVAILTAIFAAISLLTKFILIPIGEEMGGALKGGLVVVGILALLIGGIYLLSNIKPKKLLENVRATVILTAIFAAISLLTKFILIPIGEEMGSALKGSLVVIGILALLIGGIYLLSNISQNKDTDLYKNLLAVTILGLIYGGLALIIKFLIIPIGENAKEALFGTLIVVGLLAALIGGIWALSAIDTDNMNKALLYTVIMAVILLGVSLIVKEIIVPIGENAKEAFFGTLITVGLILAFGTMMFILGKILEKKESLAAMARGAIFMAAVAIVLLIVGKCVEIFAKSAKKVWDLNDNQFLGPVIYGGGLILGILAIIGFVFFLIGKLIGGDISGLEQLTGLKSLQNLKGTSKGSKAAITILKGGGFAAIIGALAALIGGEIWLFCLAASDIYKMNENDAVLLGGGIILLVLGAMTLIFAALGALSETVGVAAVIGGAVADIVGLLGDILAGEIWLICFLARDIFEMNKDEGLIKGFDLMIETIEKMAQITLAMAALSLCIPAATLAGIASLFIIPIIGATYLIVTTFMGILKQLNKTSKDELNDAADKTIFLYDLLYDIVKAAAPGILDGFRLLKAVGAVGPLLVLFTFLSEVVDKIIEINKKLKRETVIAFREMIVGKEDDEENSVIGSIVAIINGFKQLSFLTVLGVAFINKAMRPIIETVSMWIDVIMKVATMSYVSGFDENGNPEYDHLDPSVFGEAASVVTTGFKEFVDFLKDGFDGLSLLQIILIKKITYVMRPIIETVGLFVDVIMKVATGTYQVGADENGNPIFEHLDAEEFAEAADAVTSSFQNFVESLGLGFASLSDKAIDAIEEIDDNIGPIMEAVGTFVDAIIKAATLTVVVGYDDKGKPIYERISTDEFADAADKVVYYFSSFIEKLGLNFDAMHEDTVDALEDIDDNLGPIMLGVGAFVDAIMKMATGTYIKAKNPDGSYEYDQVTSDLFSKAADAICGHFCDFLGELASEIEAMEEDIDDILEELNSDGGLGPLMQSLGTFANAILTLAAGSYVDHYENDKDGKPTIPIYKPITPDMMKKAADVLTDTFITFVDRISARFSDENTVKKINAAKDALSGGIEDIMDSVKTFADTLSVISSIKTTIELPDGTKVEELICMDPEAPKRLAENVATAFISFITIIADAFTGNADLELDEFKDSNKKIIQKYKDLAEASKHVKTAMGYIKDIITSFTDILKMISENSDVGAAPNEPANISDIEGMDMGNYSSMRQSAKQSGNKITFESAPYYATIVSTAIRSFIDMFNSTNMPYSEDDMSEINAIAKKSINYFKNLSKALDKYVDILDILTSAYNDDNLYNKYPDWITRTGENVNESIKMMNNIQLDEYQLDDLTDKAKASIKYFKNLNKTLNRYKNVLETLSKIYSDNNIAQNTLNWIKLTGTNVDALISILSDNKKFSETLLDVDSEKAKALSSYLKIFKKVLSKYKSVIRTLDKNPEETAANIKGFSENMPALVAAMRVANVQIDNTDIDSLVEIFPDYVDIAKQYKVMSRYLHMLNDMSEDIRTFVSNIKILTSPEITTDMKGAVQPIRKYAKSLDLFNDSVEITTMSVKIYITTMEKARKAMASLDEQIINNNEKRNKALDDLNDRINKISDAVLALTDAVYEMSDAFDYVSETDILNMFEDTQDLVEMVTGVKKREEEEGEDTEDKNDRSSRPSRPRRSSMSDSGSGTVTNKTTNYNVPSRGLGSSGTVVFEFKDVTLHGAFRMR